jgi:hypothetical protein
MPLTLQTSPLSLAWTRIASLNIIEVFHLGLRRPHSYRHISYVFRVKVQHVLRIPLIWLVVDSSDIATWHAFLVFHS